MIDQELINKIKTAIFEAEKEHNKMVEIHYQILKNAKELSKLSSEIRNYLEKSRKHRSS